MARCATSSPTGTPREPSRRRIKGAAAPAQAHQGVRAVPTALTVKLSAASMEALARASRVNETNLTDTVNRAVQFYDFVVTALADNRRNALIIVRYGHPERIHLP